MPFSGLEELTDAENVSFEKRKVERFEKRKRISSLMLIELPLLYLCSLCVPGVVIPYDPL